jgi:hypothetical protein
MCLGLGLGLHRNSRLVTSIIDSGTLVSVTNGILTADSAYWWPVDASGDMASGTGTVDLLDGIATYTDGVETASWPVDWSPDPDDASGPFILFVTNGIGSFTPDAVTCTMPVNTI